MHRTFDAQKFEWSAAAAMRGEESKCSQG